MVLSNPQHSKHPETSPPSLTDLQLASDADLRAEATRRFSAGELLRIAVGKINALPPKDKHWLLQQIEKEYADGARELGDFEARRKAAGR